MPEEMKDIHLKIGERELKMIAMLGDYYHELKLIEKNNMASVIRYALNCLFHGTRREIESRRYGGK